MLKSWTTEKGTKIEIEATRNEIGIYVNDVVVNGKKIESNSNLIGNEIKVRFFNQIATIIVPKYILFEILSMPIVKTVKTAHDIEMDEYYAHKDSVDQEMSY